MVLAKVENAENIHSQQSTGMLGSLKQNKKIAHQLAVAYQHEQVRCSYLTEQAHQMMNIRDAWLVAQRAENEGARPGNGCYGYILQLYNYKMIRHTK